MPGFILHIGAEILCMHGATAQPLQVNPRVKVNGFPSVTQINNYTILGCPNLDPQGTPRPCVSAQWLTAALRIKASGLPILLQDSKALCSPTETGLNILNTQQRVKGQ